MSMASAKANSPEPASVEVGESVWSLLFPVVQAHQGVADADEPAFFADLNLDQLVAAVDTRKRAYELRSFFHRPLGDIDAIRFRQEVFADIERADVRSAVEAFAAQELVSHYHYQRRAMSKDTLDFAHYHRARAFLNAALGYCDAVERLVADLRLAQVGSRGLRGLLAYLDAYLAGDAFRSLRVTGRELDAQLDQVRYTFVLKGSRITVGPYDGEQPDYSAEVAATFERFRQGPDAGDEPEFRDWDAYAAIGVLQLVSKLYPDLFGALDDFCRDQAEYLDETVAVIDRELQFYLGYLEYIQPLRDAGLSFSYPSLSGQDRSLHAAGTFDLVLAAQRIPAGQQVVCNDLSLTGTERILVVTGPNNGGKTTLARTIGQLHYLAKLGCPVPGRETRLLLCDQIFTRFERREDITTLEGKLQNELNRLHDALELATPNSLFILNEMFNSTTAQDALFLSRQILGRVSRLGALCVCVTFLDELAAFNHRTVSMVSTVDPEDPALRTYKLVRRPADGRAYARALAEKHGLTYNQLTGARRR